MNFVPLNRKIIGMPLGFPPNADPLGRVYDKTLVANANIISIIPGKPLFFSGGMRRKKMKLVVDSLYEDEESSVGLSKKFKTEIEQNIFKENNEELKAIHPDKDCRFYSFAPNVSAYNKILNTLLTEVSTRLVGFDLSSPASKTKNVIDMIDVYDRGLQFYCEASSSVSESASNDLGESMLESKTKQISDMAKEMNFFLGTGSRDSTTKTLEKINQEGAGETGLGTIQKTLSFAADTAKDLVGSASEEGGAIAAGENLLLPKVWKGSSFDKSYNLTFKFVSPYGDRQSILDYVYTPFLALLPFSLPRQVGVDSYKAPMLIRMDSPGFFSCDMGMVTSFSFVRGGSENLWASNGLPLCIDVTMSITDMYPALAVASNVALLKQNVGLSDFLKNMSGLYMSRSNVTSNVTASIAQKLSSFSTFPETIVYNAQDKLDSILEKLFN